MASILLIVGLAVASSVEQFRVGRSLAGSRLEAASSVRIDQLRSWVDRQRKFAAFVADGRSMAARFQQWRARPDADTARELMVRVQGVATALDATGALVLDAEGGVLLGAPAGSDLTVESREAARQAVAARHAVLTPLFRDAAEGVPRVDMAVPLLLTAPPAQAVVLVRFDPRRTLQPALDLQLPNGVTAESRLWSVAGGRLRRASFDPAQRSGFDAEVDLAGSTIPAARALRGEMGPGRAMRAVNMAGVDVLAVAQAVPGSDWWMVSQAELATVDAPAWRRARLIAVVAALAVSGVLLATRVASQRTASRRDRRRIAEQDERIASLALLEAKDRALRQSEAHYRSVVEVMAEGVLVYAADGALRSANPAAVRIFGTDPASNGGRFGQGWLALHEDGSPMSFEQTPLGRVLEGAPLVRDELVRIRRVDGVQRLLCVTAAPIVDGEAGELSSVLVSMVDATEREQLLADLARHRDELERQVDARTRALQDANFALEAASRFSRNMIDAVPGRVAYYDRTLTCRFASRSYAQWFGHSVESIVGLKARDILSADYIAVLQPQVEGALAGQPQRFESVTTSPDGETRTDLLYFMPDDPLEQGRSGIFVMGFDITPLKQAEARLQAVADALVLSRDEANSANRAKSAFLANISHEIRTPMNAIIGLTHLMARDVREPRLQDRLDKVATAAQHLLGLIDNVLDLSKIEAGKLKLDAVDFPLHKTLADAAAMVAPQAAAKGLALTVEAHDLPERLCGDPLRLSQILINLLTNAVKFTSHGAVKVRARVEGERRHRVRLRFEVEDTGPGLSIAQQATVFSAFEQADTSITRRHGGTGLGLTLSRQLARAMDGDIGVDSQEGRGSTFWFTAALSRPDSRKEAPPDAETMPAELLDPPELPSPSDLEAMLRSRHRGQRVLLAEDNPVNREVAQELLSAAGLTVETAWDGRRAAEMAESAPFDLVLMDVQMPVMDGLEATRAIRAQLGPAMPIIAMTANVFLADRQACIEAGMDDHLAKPVAPDQLFSMLLRWLPEPAAAREQQAEPDAIDALNRRLAGILGIDIAHALRNVGGQPAALVRVLRLFSRTYRAGLPALLDVSGPEADGFNAWRAVCHSARGALETIGADRLAADVMSLEDALATPSTRSQHLDEARAIHRQIETLSRELEREIA